jgi:hypothetical protein
MRLFRPLAFFFLALGAIGIFCRGSKDGSV